MKLAQTISRFIEMANCPECKTDPEKPPFPDLKLSLQQRRFSWRLTTVYPKGPLRFPDGPVTDTNEVPDVRFNEIEAGKIDDSVLFSQLCHQLATV
jgi:hypothetical protein